MLTVSLPIYPSPIGTPNEVINEEGAHAIQTLSVQPFAQAHFAAIAELQVPPRPINSAFHPVLEGILGGLSGSISIASYSSLSCDNR